MANLPENTEIINAVNDYCEQKAISKADLATMTGISGATISNMTNGKWESITAKMWQRLWNHVRPFQDGKVFQTSDFYAVHRLCDRARGNRYMVGLTGDTGMGKTVALEAYARRGNVFYIYYNSTMRPKHFYLELGRLLGYDFDGNMYDVVNKACETLNAMDSPLIIIDEASKLTDAMVHSLHVLRDRTMRNCGMVLAGMPYFRSSLINKANRHKMGFSEFLRRIMLWHDMSGLTADEVRFVCDQNGITDAREVKALMGRRKIGDLMNDILLRNTLND